MDLLKSVRYSSGVTEQKQEEIVVSLSPIRDSMRVPPQYKPERSATKSLHCLWSLYAC